MHAMVVFRNDCMRGGIPALLGVVQHQQEKAEVVQSLSSPTVDQQSAVSVVFIESLLR